MLNWEGQKISCSLSPTQRDIDEETEEQAKSSLVFVEESLGCVGSRRGNREKALPREDRLKLWSDGSLSSKLKTKVAEGTPVSGLSTAPNRNSSSNFVRYFGDQDGCASYFQMSRAQINNVSH